MRVTPDFIGLSATDLANHLACRHLTTLNLAAAQGILTPPSWRDPAIDVLRARGLEHERAYLECLKDFRLTVVELGEIEPPETAFEQTLGAMGSGAGVIAQATLVSGRWYGRADILRRVERGSTLGNWSYEVVDTKLARETRAGTVLQLCLYSNVLAEIQGLMPEYMYVVSPGTGFQPEVFRVQDFLAYYRFVRGRLEEAVERLLHQETNTYPEPVPHCDVCRWWPACDRRRRDDDHLCLVADVSKLQTRELQRQGIETLRSLATVPLPLPFRPQRGAPQGYVRVREQARVQLDGRTRNVPVHEMLLPIELNRGLARLPEPSAGDIFLDFEGDPFVGEGGLEYLFGRVVADNHRTPEYRTRWALDRETERAAFEELVDFTMERWARFPELHIYHFGTYEPGALKRLMGRYATREVEVDRMLRAGLFVDLHSVVKQGLRASVERYSIKDLEQFYGFERVVPLRDAAARIRAVESALELSRVESIPDEARTVVESYNRDDCVSAMRLREWLEERRCELQDQGHALPRPGVQTGDPTESLDERQRRVREIAAGLSVDVPADRDHRTEQQHARWVLVALLDWHRREAKAPWWEFFRLRDLSDEELLEEKGALSGLELVARVGGTERSPVDRYSYPRQNTDIRSGNLVHMTDGEPQGAVDRIDLVARTVDVKKRGAVANVHPSSAFAHEFVNTDELADSLFLLGQWVAANGIDTAGPYRAARDLLLNCAPRLVPGAELHREGEDAVAAARRLALVLDGGVLAIQGPPGSGKTYTGARMICELVRAGRRVGVTAVSHKVIRNLLDEVVTAAKHEGTQASRKWQTSVEPRRARANRPPLARPPTRGVVTVGRRWRSRPRAAVARRARQHHDDSALHERAREFTGGVDAPCSRATSHATRALR